MNILITGTEGQLGQCLKDTVVSKAQQHNYYFTDKKTVDIIKYNDVKKFVLDNNIQMIINLAAYTNVENAEDDVMTTTMINTNGPRILAQIMKEVDGTLIHISTDYVFGNQFKTPIKEDEDTTTPLNVYGATKRLGEISITDIVGLKKYLIIRTSWLYSEYGNNFVKNIFNKTSTMEKLKVVCDQIGSPTYAPDLAFFLYYIIENNEYVDNYGIYHYSNEGVCSWYDLAYMINSYSNNCCNIIPCLSSEFQTKAERPNYSVLDKTKLKKTFEFEIPHWTDSLNDCIKKLKNNE